MEYQPLGPDKDEKVAQDQQELRGEKGRGWCRSYIFSCNSDEDT